MSECAAASQPHASGSHSRRELHRGQSGLESPPDQTCPVCSATPMQCLHNNCNSYRDPGCPPPPPPPRGISRGINLNFPMLYGVLLFIDTMQRDLSSRTAPAATSFYRDPVVTGVSCAADGTPGHSDGRLDLSYLYTPCNRPLCIVGAMYRHVPHALSMLGRPAQHACCR